MILVSFPELRQLKEMEFYDMITFLRKIGEQYNQGKSTKNEWITRLGVV